MKHRHRVLIAEDDSALSHLLTFRFNLAGFAVTTVANGVEAWLSHQNP